MELKKGAKPPAAMPSRQAKRDNIIRIAQELGIRVDPYMQTESIRLSLSAGHKNNLIRDERLTGVYNKLLDYSKNPGQYSSEYYGNLSNQFLNRAKELAAANKEDRLLQLVAESYQVYVAPGGKYLEFIFKP